MNIFKIKLCSLSMLCFALSIGQILQTSEYNTSTYKPSPLMPQTKKQRVIMGNEQMYSTMNHNRTYQHLLKTKNLRDAQTNTEFYRASSN